MEQGVRVARIALKPATKTALITVFTILGMSIFRVFLNRLLYGRWSFDWRLALVLSGVFGALLFAWTFISSYFSLRAGGPANAILERTPSLSIKTEQALSGFVGMEYYALILNRTYVVFAAPDGLYGWKAEGPVSAARPLFFEPYQKMLEDPDLMCDRQAVEDLAKLKGGFSIAGSDIAYVEAIHSSKWGMAGIPHSGRLRVGLTNGKWREFILLGAVSSEEIRDRILASTARSAVPVRA